MSGVERKLGRRVAEYRKARGLTQAQLAERSHVATETISRLERGAAIPSIARLASVAQVLGVELHELFRLWQPDDASDAAVAALVGVVRGHAPDDIACVARMAAEVLAHAKRIRDVS